MNPDSDRGALGRDAGAYLITVDTENHGQHVDEASRAGIIDHGSGHFQAGVGRHQRHKCNHALVGLAPAQQLAETVDIALQDIGKPSRNASALGLRILFPQLGHGSLRVEFLVDRCEAKIFRKVIAFVAVRVNKITTTALLDDHAQRP